MKGHFEAHDATPGRYSVELRTDDAGSYEPGQEIKVDVFSAGDRVDVVGVSKGHGTSGVMKRHGMHGLRASHGTKRKHRAPGAIGACATPSRVFKDMPMAGQFGNVRVTVLNLEVVQADAERGLLLVRGAVPGPNGGLVMARSAVKSLPGKPSAERTA
jgi:large subunit ribosomal protein L3